MNAGFGISAGAGYLFGNIPIVKDTFEIVIIAIVFVSVLPIVFALLKSSRRSAGVRQQES